MCTKNDDRDTAERLAHTLKGTAGNIGAAEVQITAKALQDAFKKQMPDDEIVELFANVENELMTVIHGLRELELHDESVSDIDNKMPDLPLLTDMLKELASLLTDDDTDANEKVEQIYVKLKNSSYEGEADEIVKRVNQYKYMDALNGLRGLAKRLDIAI